MFGLHHQPAPKIFFKFLRNFGAEGWGFLDDKDMTHIFKDKGKLNRIIKNHAITHVTFLFFFEI